MSSINIRLKNYQEVKKRFESLGTKQTSELAKRTIDEVSTNLVTYIQTKFMSGQGQIGVGTRTGKLKSSVTPIKGTVRGGRVYGGISIGEDYAITHFGDAFAYTQIVPKRAKMIAVPLSSNRKVMSSTGILKYETGKSIRTQFPYLRVARLKRDALFLVDTKGVPYFVLKNKVNVPQRIDRELIENKAEALLKDAVKQVLKSLQ